MNSIKQLMDEHIEQLAKETDQLRARLETVYDATNGKTRVSVDYEKIDQLFHQAEEIANLSNFLMKLNEAMYKNRGKASPKKAVSSKANGKFGGRPPKEIAEKKKRIQELEHKSYVLFETLTDEERKELDELSYDIVAWENRKKSHIREELENLNK